MYIEMVFGWLTYDIADEDGNGSWYSFYCIVDPHHKQGGQDTKCGALQFM